VVVTEALKEYIQVRKQREIKKIFDTIEYHPNLGYESQRIVQ
jgi:hypothetical protein